MDLTASAWGGLTLLAGALAATLILGYLVWLARHAPPAGSLPRRPVAWPSVDIILPVRNEAEWIEEKLRNLEALRYPADRLRVIVVDGASTDGTADIAREATAAIERYDRLSDGEITTLAEFVAGRVTGLAGGTP